MSFQVVLVHGYTGSPATLAPLHRALAARFGGGRITPFLLPGHGAAGAPPFDLELFLDELAGTIRRLSRDREPILLVGHSTGGTLLLHLCRRESFACAGLVLAAVPRRIVGSDLAAWEKRSEASAPLPLIDVARMVSAINAAGRDTLPLPAPVLILHGTDDELVNPAKAASWNDGVFEGRARVTMIPGAGHHLFTDSGEERSVSAVLSFCEEIASGSAVIAALLENEPSLVDFVRSSPAAAPHLAASPAARSCAGMPVLLEPRAAGAPVFANIEITGRCNLRCRFCARGIVRKEPRDMSPEAFSGVLDALPHACRVTLVGLGEPLLHPHIVDFVAGTAARKRLVGLVTNGMNLTPALARELIAAGLRSIAISIDATDQRLAAGIRSGSDMELILSNLSGFVSLARELPVDIAVFTALSRHNIASFPDIIRAVHATGVRALMVTDLNFSENGEETLMKNRAAPLVAYAREGVRLGFELGLPILSVHGLEAFGIANRYREFLLFRPAQLFDRSARLRHCHSPWQTVPVDSEGTVTVCDCQPAAVAGNLLTAPFDEVWNGKAMTAHRRLMLEGVPQPCGICPRF